MAYVAVFTAFAIAVTIAVAGKTLFGIFGITLDSFRMAGGLVLLLLGLDTIRSRRESYKETKGIDSMIAILATPLLTGPATISFITIKSYEIGTLPLIVNITVTFLFVGLAFIIIANGIPKINVRLVEIISKVLGLFLAAMAIEMISKGLSDMILHLKG
jgi:multiple antibiotic resistance protein